MINCNPLFGGNGRTRDGVKVFTRFSMAYVDRETLQIYSEIPEGREASEFASTSSGKLRQDQTGIIFEIAHDVEDAPYTYTEVFPTPESISEIVISSNGADYMARLNTNVYPDYKATTTYAQGDRVTSNGYTWESDFDGNVGNTPNIWGWSLVLPYIEQRDVEYKSLEELAASV